MVKFGRHLQFFLELEGLDDGHNHNNSNSAGEHPSYENNDMTNNAAYISRTSNNKSTSSHYIVPYNILRDAIEKGSSLRNGDHHDHHGTSTLTPASFEIAWRDALSYSNQDFSDSMNSCWKSVFDSISSYQHKQNEMNRRRNSIYGNEKNHHHYQQHSNNSEVKITTRGMELMDAIKVYTQINDVVSSRDLLCFLKDTFNAAEMNYQALRKIVKKFDKKYHTIHDKHRVHHQNQHYTNSYCDSFNFNGGMHIGNNGFVGNSDMLSVLLLPELYSSILFVGRGTLEMTISYLRELIEEITSTTSGDDEEEEADNELSYEGGQTMIQMTVEDEDDEDVLEENKNKNINPPSNKLQIDPIQEEKGSPQRNIVHSKSMNDHDQHKNYRKTSDVEEQDLVSKRAEEMQWLNNVVKIIPHSEIGYIVAHRGFHTTKGRSDYRPLENSLSAFETAWSAGIHMCACDVALTKDEKLVLAHDEDFHRLALDKTSMTSRLKVSELTFKELIALTLKNGVRAPLLKDVLMSANAIGPEAKLFISIKPGNSEAGMALARLLMKYPELIAHVAVIMSFDLFTMHSLCAEFRRLFPNAQDGSSTASYTYRRNRSTSVFGSSPSEKSQMMESIERDRSNSLTSYGSSLKVTLPQVMLLTVADQPESKFELCVDISDYSPIDGWLHGTHTSLDGVFVRCQPSMLLPEGKAALQNLAKKYTVGVWGKAGEDPDDYRMMHYLVNECGVSYYNTDLPRTFLDS